MTNIKDGEFWELFKRTFAAKYVGPDGMPGLQANQLIRPQKRVIVKSAGASWTRFYVNRAVYVWTQDARRIDFVSGEHPGDLSAEVTKPWNSAVNGVAKLYTPGEWHLKTPLLAGDVEGEAMICIMSDAALGVESGNLGPGDIAGAIQPATGMDLVKIGGIPQTGYDLVGGFVPITWGDAVAIPVDNADVSILPANAARRAFAIFNDSTGGQKIAVGITNPMTARLGFYMPGPGVGDVFNINHPAFTRQGLRAWGSAVGGSLVVAEGT